MFLREVKAFRDSVYAAEGDEDASLKTFVAIVNKFIRSGSSYEVNIDSSARAKVVRFGEEARFKELHTVSNGFGLSAPLKNADSQNTPQTQLLVLLAVCSHIVRRRGAW